ncbi:MAG: hypothetical protein OXF97_09525 [Nitrospira sp.]|nr:hypothetical protein [Nitrospira sp.]
MFQHSKLNIMEILIIALFVVVGVGFVGGQSNPLHAQSDRGCGGPCNTMDYMQNYGGYQQTYPAPQYAPAPRPRHQLNPNGWAHTQAYLRSLDSLEADIERGFRQQEEQSARIEQRNWRLQNLYQNQKPLACGPTFDPRAREGC